jgi:hypothetical protein
MQEQVSGNESPKQQHLPEAWKHLKAAGQELRKSVGAVVPPAVHEHGRAVRREVLLAARSVIDAALDCLEKRPSA